MTHQRAMLQTTTDPARPWWAAVHRCPDQVMGVGVGPDPREAFVNAEVGLINALRISPGLERATDE